MGLTVHFEVLNQLGTPLMHSATLANRPAAGIAGRIFFRTDSPFGIYRDTGTIWDLIAIGGGTVDTNIYNTDGSLTANRTVSSGGFGLTFNPATVFDTTLTAANNASSLALFGVNRLSYAAAFSANNIGSLYGGASAFALQTFAGSATFANSNVASGGSSVNSIDFSSGGSTITMTQSSGIRVMSGHQNLFQYQGTNSGTISHAAISQNTGFYRPSAATGILTITNAYSHLINALDDYGAGFIFTNRFGIYQAGASDTNYFAGQTLIGSAVSGGGGIAKLIVGSSTSDSGISIFSSLNPSLRIDNSQNFSTQRFVIGLATASNSFIQGSTNGEFCISTQSSGSMIFGMWQTVNATEVMRLSTSNNLMVGSSIDNGNRLQVTGNAFFSANVGINTTSPSSQLNVLGDIHIGDFSTSVNRTLQFRTFNSLLSISTDGTLGGLGSTISYSWANGGQGPLKFNNASGEVARFSSNGNFGINNPTPGSKLSIVGLPTSSVGLSAGDIWNNLGILNIV